MTAGRCAGCGMVRTSHRSVAEHIRNCGPYLVLWRESPDRALDPEAEFRRWQEEDRNPEAKDLAREQRLNGIFATIDAARDKATRRFRTPPDILADDEE